MTSSLAVCSKRASHLHDPKMPATSASLAFGGGEGGDGKFGGWNGAGGKNGEGGDGLGGGGGFGKGGLVGGLSGGVDGGGEGELGGGDWLQSTSLTDVAIATSA